MSHTSRSQCKVTLWTCTHVRSVLVRTHFGPSEQVLLNRDLPSLLYNGYRVSLPGVQRPGRGINHPPPFSAEVKEIIDINLFFPFGPSWPVLGELQLFVPFFIQGYPWIKQSIIKRIRLLISCIIAQFELLRPSRVLLSHVHVALQLGDAHVVQCLTKARANQERHWNNRKYGASKLRFPCAKQFLRRLSAIWARTLKFRQLSFTPKERKEHWF